MVYIFKDEIKYVVEMEGLEDGCAVMITLDSGQPKGKANLLF